MDTRNRRPPIIDMTPEGEFREPPLRRPSRFDRVLARVGGIAILLAVAAGGLVLAALAVLSLAVLLPVAIVAAAIGAGSLWWRLRRARRTGSGVPPGPGGRMMRFVIIRR
jgi:UDP-N-acetylmuramyl pentapeptide phosphotransferase/UDP-N-acetylglucosamine-1-phosphate transferase